MIIQPHRSARSFVALVGFLGLLLVKPMAAEQPPHFTSADSIRALLKKYQFEREAAKGVSSGKFSPELFKQADLKAKKAEELLSSGRLEEARESVGDALWYLP